MAINKGVNKIIFKIFKEKKSSNETASLKKGGARRRRSLQGCTLTCVPLRLAQVQHDDADVLAELARVGELAAALATL